MTTLSSIQQLISVAAPYWAGEAEVVNTYWTSPVRARDTDLLWLSRQCFKEFWGSGVSKLDRGGVFLGVLKSLVAKTPEIDVSFERHDVLAALEGLKAEFSHYCKFADIYDSLRPAGTSPLNPARLESWPEEDMLTAIRYRHQEQHGAVGLRACKFTEGGYCTLFSAGMSLKGKGGIEEKIADACAFVFEDEFDHMVAGVADIGRENLSAVDWKLFEKLVVEQSRQRILMRNAQFSRPLSDSRVEAIFRGEIQPLSFDYKRAGLAA